MVYSYLNTCIMVGYWVLFKSYKQACEVIKIKRLVKT
jgi:hypothetical protein